MADNREKIIIDIETDTRSVSELQQRIKSIKDQMVGLKDQDAFNKLATEAGQLRNEIEKGEEAINEFAASQDKLNGMSGAFGSMTRSLKAMNFDKALEGAQRFATLSKSMTFGGAIKSLKKLGQTFKVLGKALLKNPYFLIAVIFAAIGYAIYKLLDELGLLSIMFDALGKYIDFILAPIKALIQQLKNLTDWMGWTDNAGEELAKNTIERNERVMASNKKKSDAYISQLDFEINKMKARGEDASKLELKRLKDIQKFREKEVLLAIESSEAILKTKGKDSEEYKDQIKAIEEIQKAYIQSGRDIEMFNINQDEKAKAKKAKDASDLKAERKKGHEAYEALKEKGVQEAKATADAQKAIDRQLKEFKINQIDNEIDRAEKLRIFKENNSFADIDREKLTDKEIEQLKVNHTATLKAIGDEAIKKRIEQEDSKQDKLKQARLDWEKNNLDQDEEKDPVKIAQAELDLSIKNLRDLLEAKAITQKEFDELEKERKQQHADQLVDIEKKRLAVEGNAQKAGQQALYSASSDLMNALGSLAEEGSATQKAFALANIIAAQAESLAKAIPVALDAAADTGPGAPFVFAATLIGIVTSIVTSIANAKKVLSSSKAKGSSGGGGGGGSIPSPNIPSPERSTPSISMYGNENDTGNLYEGGSKDRGNGQPLKAYVSWSDLEDVSNSNNNVLNQMAL